MAKQKIYSMFYLITQRGNAIIMHFFIHYMCRGYRFSYFKLDILKKILISHKKVPVNTGAVQKLLCQYQMCSKLIISVPQGYTLVSTDILVDINM